MVFYTFLPGQHQANFYRVEKYRPIFLDDIVGNTETVERLKIIAKDGNMPHVIISGMPGIGKTTSILCLARQLLGDAYKEAVLELNASDERGECRKTSLVSSWLNLSGPRYRCGPKSNQRLRTEEGYATTGSS
jgi:Holliday junction DNA helicase RuvB P-loop domain